MKRLVIALAASTAIAACTTSAPPDAEEARRAEVESTSADSQRDHLEQAQRLEQRVMNLEREWSEMEGKIASNKAAPTAPMRTEVKEDVANARKAVEDLKTTTPDNWWQRHEGAMERTTEEIAADVQRFAAVNKGEKATGTRGVVKQEELPASAAPFASRRDQFVEKTRARLEEMEAQLENVKVRDAQKTELNDTRARISKLKDDLDRLRTASADDWWKISYERVSEYVDRLDGSIRRLDNDKPADRSRVSQ